MYIRFRTTAEPIEIKVEVVSDGVASNVTEQVEIINKTKLEPLYVDELPPIGEAKENIIYSVKNSGKEDGNVRDEFIFSNGKYERLGSETLSVEDSEIDALFKKS